MKKTVIVMPTYNEGGNIRKLLNEVFSAVPNIYVLIVDDNSPDGTAVIVRELQNIYPNLLLFEREKKEGLGVAYREGFKRVLALHPDTEIIGMMDADFYHNPKDLPHLLEAILDYDLVIGSVYEKGGSVPPSFTLLRRMLSKGGNLYCRLFFGYRLTDWTNAFALIKVSSLRKIDLDSLISKEFAFIFGLKYMLLESGASWKDVGVVAAERKEGESKITPGTIFEALMAPWRLLLYKKRK